MPPKTKYTKEEIVNASLRIASRYSIDEVKAREVAAVLGSSPRPIFTHFDSMDSLREEVKKKALELFDSYLKIADNYTPSFKMRGMQLIKFAQNEPNLFRMLFMTTEKSKPFNEYIKDHIANYESDIPGIIKAYSISREDAEFIFGQLWIHSYGICVMCVTGVCGIPESTITRMLGECFEGEILLAKSGITKLASFPPVPNDSEKASVMSKPFTEIKEEKQ